MDRALDDVVRERSHDKRSSSSSNGRRSRRNPRGGVRKTGRRDNTYNDSLAWVHDKYDGDLGLATNEPLRRAAGSDVRHNSDAAIPVGAGRLRVENIHYELGEEELLGLFERQGVVLKLELKYDRAGRSEGIAFVTYEREADAKRAIAEFDGANANGQPIHLTLVHHPQSEGKSLFDRIRVPDSSAPPLTNAPSSARDRARRYTDSPERDSRRDPTRRPTPPNIDRYVPPERRRERPRSSEPTVGGSSARRRGAYSGPGGGGGGGGGREDRSYNNNNRRYGNGHATGFGRLGGGGGGGGGGAGNRARKTVEELDEEMNNYFTDAGAQQQQQQGQQQVGSALAQQADEDEEMIL